MTRKSRQFGSTRGGRSSRQMIWSAGPFSSVIQSATGASLVIVDTGQSTGGGLTVIRIRGELKLWLSLVSAVGDGFTSITAGIGVASSDAFTVGGSSLPSPQGDPDWDWMWFYAGSALVGEATTEVFRSPMSAVSIPIDTKAMRILKPNTTVFGAVSFGTEVGTAEADFVMNSRMLSKLG